MLAISWRQLSVRRRFEAIFAQSYRANFVSARILKNRRGRRVRKKRKWIFLKASPVFFSGVIQRWLAVEPLLRSWQSRDHRAACRWISTKRWQMNRDKYLLIEDGRREGRRIALQSFNAISLPAFAEPGGKKRWKRAKVSAFPVLPLPCALTARSPGCFCRLILFLSLPFR